MLWSKRWAVLVLTLACGPAAAAGGGYILGVGVEADNSDSSAFSAFGDFGLTEKTWLSATAGRSQAQGAVNEIDTVYGDVGLDHHFDPIGIRIGAAYWGDDELLDSVDARGSIYFRSKSVSLSAEFERRNFDFVINLEPLFPRREVGFEADGYGTNIRIDAGKRVSLYARGMTYDYSVDLTALQTISDLNFLAASRLSLANSLLDYRADLGIDFKFGLRSLSLEAGRRQTAIDGSRVDSIGAGFLFPVGDSSDIELRVGYDDSDSFGGTTVLSFFWFFYGT